VKAEEIINAEDDDDVWDELSWLEAEDNNATENEGTDSNGLRIRHLA
jgi:hypothetical protein